MKEKMFAVLDNHDIVIDMWMAATFEEAQNDNPKYKVIEVTLENSPFTMHKKYLEKDKL